jgi:hypothetical protein
MQILNLQPSKMHPTKIYKKTEGWELVLNSRKPQQIQINLKINIDLVREVELHNC